MNLNITISVDDINPKSGYRVLGEKTEHWFRKLNEDYGAKFTAFIPSNYHNQFPLSENQEWIQELNSIPWIECAAHGHYHMTSDPKRFGECEMLELDTFDKCSRRYGQIINEWHCAGVEAGNWGWRNPGWLCHPEWNNFFNYERFPPKYVAVHYDHNQDMEWNCKTFFGHDGIQQEHIFIHDDNMIMLQSHIAGTHNRNVWNEDNYDQLRLSLDHLLNHYRCEFKTLNECL